MGNITNSLVFCFPLALCSILNAFVNREGVFVKCMPVVLRCWRLPELYKSKGEQDYPEGAFECLLASVSSVISEIGFHQLPVFSFLTTVQVE